MKNLILMSCLALGLTASGCAVDLAHDGGGHYDDDVLLTVEWSVDGTTHAEECDASGARYAHIQVRSSYGLEDEHEVACDAFGYDFYLPPGRYWVEIELLDRSHRQRTETVETDPRYLEDDDYVVIDFPADSFL